MDMREKIRNLRIKKIRRLKKQGINIYPSISFRNSSIADCLKNFSLWARKKRKIILAGRIMSLRFQGGIIFLDLADATGIFQLVFKKEETQNFDLIKEFLDSGDFLEAQGYLFKTQKGEKSLFVKKWRILSKALRTLPSIWYGLKDIEERFRRRYLDLIFNSEVKERFIKRSIVIKHLRDYLEKAGFMEVETPILQTLAGGALARPFKTKMEALKMVLYLRIAPELYLKKLIVGGFEKIYEIGKNFRNEGLDRSHNPEFTMLELYWAYQNYQGMMDFMEDLMIYLLKKLFVQSKNPLLLNYQGQLINFAKPWPRKEFSQIIQELAGLDVNEVTEKEILKKLQEKGVSITEETNKQHKWELLDEVYKKICLPQIIQPTFIIHHPLGISPLAKKRETNSFEVERFQLVTAGLEYMNGYSELNDPLEQAERFREQAKRRKAGNLEASPFDRDFLEALEYGMPPTAGVGIGIDRLVMLLTNAPNIKEVIFFPFMKEK